MQQQHQQQNLFPNSPYNFNPQQQQQQHPYNSGRRSGGSSRDPFRGDEDDDDYPSNGRSRRSPPMALTLENDLPSVMQFPVGVSDVGGSLVVELGIDTSRVSKKKFFLSHEKNLL